MLLPNQLFCNRPEKEELISCRDSGFVVLLGMLSSLEVKVLRPT
jgi:hypothetical protein